MIPLPRHTMRRTSGSLIETALMLGERRRRTPLRKQTSTPLPRWTELASLRLEHGLAGLEARFAEIRREKLDKQQPMTTEEHAYLAAFVAAAKFRTKASRDHQAGQWQNVLRVADDLAQRMKTASPEQKRAAAQIGKSSSKKHDTLTHDQVRQLAKTPLQIMMPAVLREVTPILARSICGYCVRMTL